ncbi:voltage-gated potassium channel [Aureococcus anophagefferens]|uniref:Voltage-gated potassium channel n=1 Tax=Aureococcus anophagefferens TaxID=44056 RepID=A0ABR1FNK6_AURAN
MTTASSIFVTHGDEGDVDEPFTVKLALKPGKGAAARILRQFCKPWTQTARGAASEFRDANVRELSHRVADIDMKIDAWATSVQGSRREPTAPLVSFRSTASKEARPVKHFAKRGNDFFYHGKGYVHAGGVEIFPRRQKRWFKLVNPTDASYRAWTWLLIPALIWTAVALPFEMAFTLSVHARTASHGGRFLFTVNRVCDLYFAADFLLMFSVAYFDNKHDAWILDRRRIAAKYLRGWCVVDLASIVPYDIFADDSYGASTFCGSCGSRALKLIRVSRASAV